MKTKAEIIAWLKKPDSIRVLLVEVAAVRLPNGSTQNFYFSNRPFISRSTDVPANQSYTAAISGGITFSESVSLDGSANVGFGDIAITNTDNILAADTWLTYVWANKPVSIFIGDATWPKDDFYNIFNGLVKDIDTSDRNSVNLILVNRLEKLNVAVSETKVGGAGTNSDQLIPLTFGECFNVTPLLINPATLTYQVHTGPIEKIIEVRDNGAPLTGTSLPTVNLTNGTFTLTASPFGTITASVQGYKKSATTYRSRVGSVIASIIVDYVT